jgi:2-dehydropantoate 2-reductase
MMNGSHCSMKSNESILIVGTGAMACLFAARLTDAGYFVHMLGTWDETIEKIAENGVRLVDLDGHSQTFRVQISSDPAAFPDSRLALVLVKSWQTKSAAERLSKCLSTDGLVLTLQNGLGNFNTLAEILGSERVMVGSTNTGATVLEPGVIRPAGIGGISLGWHPSQAVIATVLSQSGFRVETVQNIKGLMWGKLVISSAINPLTAILDIKNGDLLELEPARELMNLVARESGEVASRLGIQLPYPNPSAAAEKVAGDTAQNRSSMLQDITRGAPTEIDAICGQIVKSGEMAGIYTPLNFTLWKLVKSRLAARGYLHFEMNGAKQA